MLHNDQVVENDNTCTFAAGQSISSAINLASIGPRGLGLVVPAVWTAANIGFDISLDGETWGPCNDKTGSRFVVSGIATAQFAYYETPAGLWGIGTLPYMRLVSLSTSDNSTPVNQAAARSLVVCMAG
jgi:hypothetical protein